MNQALKRQFEGHKTLIAGLGMTGLSVARFLHRCGYYFEVIDDCEYPPALEELKKEIPNIKFHTGLSKREHFNSVENIVVSPGVSLHIPTLREADKDGKNIISDIEIFAHCVRAGQKIAAITGTNGKTTVTALVTAMFDHSGISVAAGGNFGHPVLELLKKHIEVYVLELSSFQLESTHSLHPDVSVVLNITEDHMDRYDSFAAYRDTKLRIHNNSSCIIVNRSDTNTFPSNDKSIVSFGLDVPPCANHFGVIESVKGPAIVCGDDMWINCEDLGLSGEAGILNTQSAFAIGKTLGLRKETMVKTAHQFTQIPHRLETIGKHKGVDWINDSKATNVGATLLALRSSDKPTILICGGAGKSTDFRPLKDAIKESNVVAVIVMGEERDKIQSALQDCASIHRVEDMRSATDKAQKLARDGYRVLLSPACTSFDKYENYIKRGEDFTKQFKRIKEQSEEFIQ